MQNRLIRVLHVVPNMQQGGLENYIMNLYRKVDRAVIQFDFLEHYSKDNYFDDEIRDMGGTIYRIPLMENGDVFNYSKKLRALFAERKDIKIVHGHMATTAFLYLRIAKEMGVPARIIHAHEASYLKTPRGYLRKALIQHSWKNATLRVACSEKAGEYFYRGHDYLVFRNAIDTKRFAFSEDSRLAFRKRHSIPTSAFVLGHIGRFSPEKNQAFLIDLLAASLKLSEDAYLIMIGEGKTREDVMAYAKDSRVLDHIRMIPPTYTPEEAYSAMDVFVLPSIYEGLPLTGVEAQCSGLPCVFSSNVTQEASFSDKNTFLPLLEGAEIWAENIMRWQKVSNSRVVPEQIIKRGYDAEQNSFDMQQLYTELGCQ